VGAGDFTTAEFVAKLATLPLHYQPGSTWDYSYSTDVLGMKDTSFYVPKPARQARIAEPFPEDRTIGAGATIGNPRVVQKFESGGGGLVSTAGEYNWGGAGGTYMWVDPRNNMFVLFMMQSPKQRVPYRSILRNMVYASMER
jgi:CubicO group peptidase (beta-lactamase class C family)